MSVKVINRPARITTPLTRPEEHALAAPPSQGDAAPGGIPLQTLLPVLGSMSSITMMVVLRGNPVMVMVGGIVLVVALVGGVGMAVSQRGNAARVRKRERERYLDYLEVQRGTLRDRHAATRRAALLLNPDPASLVDVARDPERLWERRRSDDDFVCPRVGLGVVPWLPLTLPAESNPVQPHDTIMAGEARTVLEGHSQIAGMPVTVDLRDIGQVSAVGTPELLYPFIRAVLGQLAVFHAPDDLKIGIAVPPERAAQIAGVDLFPHLLTDQWDGPVCARRIAPTPAALLALMREDITNRASRALARQRGNAGSIVETAMVLVIDDTGDEPARMQLPEGLSPAQLGITVITLVTDRLREPGDTRVRLTLVGDTDNDATVAIDDDRLPGRRGTAQTMDTMSGELFAALASRLAPLRLSQASRDESDAAREIDVLELLGIPRITSVSPSQWRTRSLRDFLRVPVAVGDDGAPVHIDLKESAHGGMGPHGICIGATGSGKSEFLRTLILSLAISHSPEDLAMILVDYKGGAAFTPLAGLPHIAGLIDNLADDAQLIERARASIQGEIVRRQRLLKDAGSFASIADYRAARATNPDAQPLPHLFLVIDEFGELLTAEPDFIEVLLQIGRIGRALGIHLLLSSQRIEGGKLKGLDTYLSYRIGLRTFSEQESSVILETPDAFHLPPVPGYGYLKVDTTVYTRFKAGYVSGPLPTDAARQIRDDEEKRWGAFLQPTYNTIDSDTTADAAVIPATAAGPSLIDEAVARLRPGTTPTTPIWLPTLPDRFPLFQIIDHPDRKPLHIPVGLVDEPLRQAQRPWELDLTRSGGHFAIIGAPQTGRTTFLRAFAAGCATVTTPRQVAMYGLDLTGAGLARLEDFPHVGGVATRANREQQVRLLEELAAMISHRETLFRVHRIESLAQFRSRHATGELPSIVAPDIVLLVDGYGLTRTDFDDLAEPLAGLLTRGGSFGIHLVIALTRWNELSMSLQPLIGNKYELRLNDPTESSIKRKLAETIRADQPGRVLTDEQLFAQVALPAIDDVEDDDLGDALTALAQQTAAAWNGPSASPIRLLPEDLDPATLPDEFDEPDHVPIGLRQDTMEAALLDLAGTDQHVLVLGDAGSGKTTFLRQIMSGLIDRHTPEELVIALMEPRGALASTIPDAYLGGHANNATKAKQLAAALALELDKRQNDGAPVDLRIVVLIDDYDILASGGSNPLDPLLPYLPSARDLGLNVVLTRPVAGSARALYENAIQILKDTGGTGIVLSGERSEGPLWPGVHASAAVPGRAKLVRRGQPPRLIQIAHRAT